MSSTISLVPIQALTSTNINGVQMTGPFILVRTTTTVAQQVQAQRKLRRQEQISPKEPEMLRCKRRTDGKGLHHLLPKPQPATVARRNERERNRVKMVNLGFETLREHVPDGKKNKKLSKVDTLKSAVEYIRQLQQLLKYTDTDSNMDAENENKPKEITENGEVSHSQFVQKSANDQVFQNNENYREEKEYFQTRDIFPNNNEQLSNGHSVMSYQSVDEEIDQLDNSRVTYHQLQPFNYNSDNTLSYETGSTTSGYCSDNYQYQNHYSPMQHSPATSYISMQHSPSSDNLSESFSSEEDELPDLRSWFS